MQIELRRMESISNCMGPIYRMHFLGGGQFFDGTSDFFPEKEGLHFKSLEEVFNQLNICKPIACEKVHSLSAFVYNNLAINIYGKKLKKKPVTNISQAEVLS